eukprot:843094-Amorphochlora_amoeboformis.AAC.1
MLFDGLLPRDETKKQSNKQQTPNRKASSVKRGKPVQTPERWMGRKKVRWVPWVPDAVDTLASEDSSEPKN